MVAESLKALLCKLRSMKRRDIISKFRLYNTFNRALLSLGVNNLYYNDALFYDCMYLSMPNFFKTSLRSAGNIAPAGGWFLDLK